MHLKGPIRGTAVQGCRMMVVVGPGGIGPRLLAQIKTGGVAILVLSNNSQAELLSKDTKDGSQGSVNVAVHGPSTAWGAMSTC